MKRWFSSPSFTLLITAVTGWLLLAPWIDIQIFLAQGDHGRELYIFQRTIEGEVAFRDYWWLYGPLMPYYYAGFMKIMGVTITSVLVGKMLLTLTTGLLIFIALRPLAGSLIAYCGALWFFLFHDNFFHTYNHAGGITMIAAMCAVMIRYIITQKVRWIWIGGATSLIMALIKLNFGIISILALLTTALVTDRVTTTRITPPKIRAYLGLVFIWPLMILGIYWSLVRQLTWAELLQCFPYLDQYHQGSLPLWIAIKRFLQESIGTLLSNPKILLFGAIVISCLIWTVRLMVLKELDLKKRQTALLLIITLSAYYILCLHEYFKTGISYCLFWPQPVGIILAFSLIATAVSTAPRIHRILILGTIAILCVAQYTDQRTFFKDFRRPEHYLDTPKTGVYIRNAPTWIKTVKDTTAFLNKTLTPDESFFALPYDPLYYYLADKKSPSWLLCLCDLMNIPPEQEQRVIKELEEKKINYILVSNRQQSSEQGLGTFGVTYCPLLARYIQSTFEPVAQFGDWENEGGWAWNHGTVILKRKTSLK